MIPEEYLKDSRRSRDPVSSMNSDVITSIGIGMSWSAILMRDPEIVLAA
jgi:hypothetical protein